MNKSKERTFQAEETASAKVLGQDHVGPDARVGRDESGRDRSMDDMWKGVGGQMRWPLVRRGDTLFESIAWVWVYVCVHFCVLTQIVVYQCLKTL